MGGCYLVGARKNTDDKLTHPRELPVHVREFCKVNEFGLLTEGVRNRTLGQWLSNAEVVCRTAWHLVAWIEVETNQ